MAAIDPREHGEKACDGSIRRAFDFLGKRWSGVILGTLMNGAAGFAELKRAIDGISDSVLSDRLVELADADLVRRTVDPGPPVTVTTLTVSGSGRPKHVVVVDTIGRAANGKVDYRRLEDLAVERLG